MPNYLTMPKQHKTTAPTTTKKSTHTNATYLSPMEIASKWEAVLKGEVNNILFKHYYNLFKFLL